MWARRGRWALVVCALGLACFVVALGAAVARENIRDRGRLFDALRDRNNAAMDSSKRATRRIDLLTEKIDRQSAEIQALREQVVSSGATPVTVTTVRRSGATTVPRAAPRPGPAPTTTTTPRSTTSTTRPTCSTVPLVGRCLP